MRIIYQAGPVSIVEAEGEFYVYNGARLVRVCPSSGMAHEVAAGEL